MAIRNNLAVFLSIDMTLKGPTTPGQRELGNKDNEVVLNIPKSSWTGTTTSHAISSLIEDTLWDWVLPTSRDKVGVFCWSSRLGWNVYCYDYNQPFTNLLDFRIKLARRFDVPLNKLTKLKQTKYK